MLSLSLRRRSAPGTMNVRDHSTPKQQKASMPSVSSRKSLSSLFSIAAKDGDSKAPKSSDEIGIVEQVQYPVYDPTNSEQNPEAKGRFKTSKRRSRSSSRSASSGPRTFLDALASKMRAATEFFHKTPSSNSPNSLESDTLPPSRSVSPKKSVRFKSGTYSDGDPKSSPIDVPKRSAPVLPHLELPKTPFTNGFSSMPDDPIPTGRPPATPVLKGKEDLGYFAAPIEPKSFIGFKDALQQNQPTLPGLSNATNLPAEDPFDDAAAVSDVEDYPKPVGVLPSDQHQRKSLPSSTASVVDLESSNERKLRMAQSSSDKSGATSDTLFEEEEDRQEGRQKDAAAIEETAVAKEDAPVHEESPARVGAGYRPPSAQISYTIVQSLLVSEATIPQSVGGLSGTKSRSIWTLESRNSLSNVGEDCNSDSDAGVEHSALASPSRSHQGRPTHEDIRQKFRGSNAHNAADVVTSSTSDASNVKCEASIAKVQNESNKDGVSPNTENKPVLATADPPKVTLTILDPNGSTDMQQSLPQETPRQNMSEQAVVVPQDAVSPLNLKANVSSTSPSRTRRPFRFSNSTDRDSSVSPISNTSFSWHAKKAGEEGTPPITNFQSQTPSPVSVPLPLSIAPKKLPLHLKQDFDRHVDAHGWSPFDEGRFPEALLTSPSLHSLLLANGGFAAFWKETGLPQESAPGSDSHVVSQERLVVLLQAASRVRTGQDSPEREKITVAANAMDQMFSPWVASNTNKFAALATHHNDYSGEVSTIDISTLDVCSEPGQNCSDAGCNMCMTRESYDSSTDRSMLGSLSGYESDMEGLMSDKDSAYPSGIHTPTRLPRPLANDRTPKQNDFAKDTLTRSNAKYLQGSEASEASVSTVGGMTEDEKFAKGIV